MRFVFLSGQARRDSRATNSLIATVRDVQIQNSLADFAPSEPQGSGGGIRVQLDGYTINSLGFTERIAAGTATRSFSEFPLQITRLEEVNNLGTGTTTLFNGNFTVSPAIPVNVRLLPGRTTTLNLKLNDAILNWDTTTSAITFDRFQFELENENPVDGRVNGFLSDYVAYDLRSMTAARPRMSNGQFAERILFSGDSVALAFGNDSNGSLEVLPATTGVDVRFQGIIREPQQVADRVAPGTYAITEPDPRNPLDPNASVLTAMQGTWRAHTDVLDYTRAPQFAMVVIPNSEDAFPTADGADGFQVLAYSHVNGNVRVMYQGRVRFTSASAGVVEMWSVDQIADATPNNPAIGTINNFELRNGRVVAGDFAITTVPAGFSLPQTGSFRVLR